MIFLKIIEWIIIIDIILSWLPLLGIQIIIPFFRSVLDPLYFFIKKYIPTTVAGLDFTPFIIMLCIQFILSGIARFGIIF